MKQIKYLLAGIFLLSATISFAQQPINFVPKNATMVFTINHQNLFNKMPNEKINANEFIQQILDKSFKHIEPAPKVQDLGISQTQSSYFYTIISDSAQYMGYTFGINNVLNFEKVLNKDSLIVRNTDGTSQLDLGAAILKWNGTTAQLLNVNATYSYFNYDVYKRYGFELDTTNYWDPKSSKYKREITKIWSTKFLNSSYKSASSNKSFKKAQNKTADANFWIDADFFSTYSQKYSKLMMAPMSRKLKGNQNTQPFITQDYLYGNLFFNKENITFSVQSKINKSDWKKYKDIYDAKLNSNLTNHLSQNDIAYYSFAMNSEAFMKNFNEFTQPYASLMGEAGHLFTDAIDLVNLAIDEEALAKIFPGDGIVVLNDINEKEVEYTAYEWDTAYNRTEVIKTKMSPRPDLSLLLNTNDPQSIEKIFRLLLKSKKLISKNGYFKVKEDEKEFDVFLGVRNNMFYVTNSEAKAKAYAENNLPNTPISASKKNMLISKISVLYLNSNGLMSNLTPPKGRRNKKTYEYAQQNVRDTYMFFDPVKGGKSNGKFVIETPSNNANSLEFIFNFINQMNQIK